MSWSARIAWQTVERGIERQGSRHAGADTVCKARSPARWKIHLLPKQEGMYKKRHQHRKGLRWYCPVWARPDGGRCHCRVGPTLATGMVGLRKGRGQVAVLQDQKPGGCNYHHDWQCWSGGQWDLTFRTRRMFTELCIPGGKIARQATARFIKRNQGWKNGKQRAVPPCAVSWREPVFGPKTQELKRRPCSQEEGSWNTEARMHGNDTPGPH